MAQHSITVARGDGIGPEIMEATLSILKAAGAELNIEEVEVGEHVYLKGVTSGISPEAWDSIRKTRVLLKAPITTPQGGGYKSLNVTIRKSMGLYANVRPVRSLHPYVKTKHPKMDLVIVRENEEDLYAGIEYQQSDEVYQCLKVITRPGCERIVRYAFEYAKQTKRKKVTCFSKDNIMKMTDGLFHKVFDEMSPAFPEIEKNHWIVDIGSALLADSPEIFDVIVVENLYGDILSDIAAQIAGSVGMGGSANLGEHCAMFEAIHGSAPDIAGKGIANPSGLLNGAVMMLVHLGEQAVAERVENAWLKTIEDGVHTGDIFQDGISIRKVGTQEFAESVIERLGQKPTRLPARSYGESTGSCKVPGYTFSEKVAQKVLIGVDLFVHERDRNPDHLAQKMEDLWKDAVLKLSNISNRGVAVWPNGHPETLCTDQWRCRFESVGQVEIAKEQILKLLELCNESGVDVVKTENLYTFDGQLAYTAGQGQ